jgi:hypothetical protein
MEDYANMFGFHVIAPNGEYEDTEICEEEELGRDCTYPHCSCEGGEYEEETTPDVTQLLKRARIEDGFYEEDY